MKCFFKNSLIIALVMAFVHSQAQEKDLVKFVDPLIGTAKMGHTYPGATAPFGMVQLSPDTDTIPFAVNGKYNPDVYKYCAGYQYDDPTIVGFSHTHFSGTGHSDLGDFLLMPTTGKLQLNPGTASNPDSGYRSRFSHKNENAEAGYYQVELEDYNINAEFTASERVGMHQYTFNTDAENHLIFDLTHGIYNYDGKNVWTFVRVENDTLVTGFRQTNGWARTRTVYFAMSFNKPIKNYGHQKNGKQTYTGFWRKFDQTKNFPEMAGEKIRAWFDFDIQKGEKLKVKFALSPVSTEGAIKNMKAEVPHWSFEKLKQETQQNWNKELHKITVEAGNEKEMTNFYTAMYHSFLGPTIYDDVNKKYRGLDQNIHQAEGFNNFTSFSLWDTYRAQHPLLNLIQTDRNNDMIKSMLAHYDQSVHSMLPVWSHYANENWCMIGYHSVPVIADAIINETSNFDEKRALEACVQTARTRYYDGIGSYIDLGYVAEDKSGASVSKTLEYAYDDYCIAQIAKKIGEDEIYAEFKKRSENWRNVYDRSIGFMRPKLSDGSFLKDFDPLNTSQLGFIEGNSWNYSLYVPHEPKEMIQLMGGEKQFSQHLDSLFTMELPDKYFEHTEDISRDGIIANYVHGNEPSHHILYYYNYMDQAWKAQEKIRLILNEMYNPSPAGLGGNDDFGQMSAWYIFNSIGFYPMAPASGEFMLGSPKIYKADVKLPKGKQLHIEAKNQSEKNVYVKSVTLNGKAITNGIITFKELMEGGELVFKMSRKPNK